MKRKYQKKRKKKIPLLLAVLFLGALFWPHQPKTPPAGETTAEIQTEWESSETVSSEAVIVETETDEADLPAETESQIVLSPEAGSQTEAESAREEERGNRASIIDPEYIPSYSGNAFIRINGNHPFFTAEDLTTEAFEIYSDLDSLGRCGTAYANICRELMPSAERDLIGSIRPSGWHTVKYAGIDGNYLYNRCHLIAYCLSGENDNVKNLITGTRYLNVQGMLPFETKTADYAERTGNHVLYRVTPVFESENLLADGVLIEAFSVEDNGEGICFCVYCYNVQPGITIDYKTGDSTGPEFTGSEETQTKESKPASSVVSSGVGESKALSEKTTYVCNTNTHKFHRPGCSSINDMAQKNLKEVSCGRQELIDEGYEPCKRCNP